MGNRNVLERDIKLLWGRAAARCSFPGCPLECIEDATDKDRDAVLGIMCHIVAHSKGKPHSKGGPRRDLNYPDNELDKYENLILLCSTHHDMVDKQENTYTVEDLRRWKTEHETWVKETLIAEMPDVSYLELEQVCTAITLPPFRIDETVTIKYPLTPTEKMERNDLTDVTLQYLQYGVGKAKEVAEYVEFEASINSQFPDRLKAGFVNEYNRLRKIGFNGDDLFTGLYEFTRTGNREFRRMAAGVAVLVYLFEKCEVFET